MSGAKSFIGTTAPRRRTCRETDVATGERVLQHSIEAQRRDLSDTAGQKLFDRRRC